MPVQACQHQGRPGFRWGPTGKCYTYTPGDPTSRARAYEQATLQGRAIQARRRQERQHLDRQGRPRLGVRYPDVIEARYMAWAQRRVKDTHTLTMRRLKAPLEQAAPVINEAARQDRADAAELVELRRELVTLQAVRDSKAIRDRRPWLRRDQTPEIEAITRRLIRVVDTTERVFGNQAPSGAAMLAKEAAAMDVGATAHLNRSVKRVYGIDVAQDPRLNQALRAQWVQDNVDLITTIDSRYFDDIRKVITEGLDEGVNTRELTALFGERFRVSQSRARLIVRDQIGKLNGQLNQARQTEIGVTHYIWRNSEDERVRDEHEPWPAGVADHRWSWADGSPEGHPGEPIQCRCVAEPFISDPSQLRTRTS